MDTKILQPTKENIAVCADEIKSGGIVGFPTETVYGLGASALDERAIAKIFECKGRPSDNPLIVHIGAVGQIYELASDVTPLGEKLANHFMPGALTLVFNKKPHIPSVVTGGLNTVALRMPSNQIAIDFINACGVPLAAPSANLSTTPSPTCAEHVYGDLKGRLNYIIDGGACRIGLESTVVDVRGDVPIILRAGGVSKEEIEAVSGSVKLANSFIKGDEKPLSPGMKYKHYSPKANVIVCENDGNAVKKVTDQCEEQTKGGKKCVVMCVAEFAAQLSGEYNVKCSSDLAEYAKNLYADLRACDDEGYDCIIAVLCGNSEIGLAINNRLLKASGGKKL